MDRRRRNLLALGAAALISLVAAGIALKLRANEGQPHFAPTEFLPGFAAQVNHATRIHIVSRSGSFDVTYTADKGWVLPSRGNYPADFEEVRHTLIGLAALETIEPKTARPDWFHYIGLDTPPKGNGVSIIVSDAQGKTLASLIAGNLEDLGDPGGSAGLFVRHPGDNQSWLARAVFVPHGEPGEWVLSRVMDIDAARLKDMTVSAPGRSFTLARAHPSDQDYVLTPAAKSANPAALDTIPTVITSFGFTDVRSGAGLDFSKGLHVTAHTFDGLTLSLDVVPDGGDAWARLSASATPGAPPSVTAEAGAIDARAAGWAYKLNPDKARLLMIDPRTPAPSTGPG
jgi:hypothetical protein